MKYRIFLTVFLGLIVLSGCDQKKEETSKEHNRSTASGAIEVEENADYKVNKVALKQHDANTSQVFYYDYQQDKKTAQSVEEKNYTPTGAALNVRSPYEHVEISLLVSKLSKEFMVKCSACHDDYANGIIGPSLLSKDSAYISETIKKYQTGEKENALMKDLVKQLDDKQIQALADEIYTFNQQIKKIKERRQ